MKLPENPYDLIVPQNPDFRFDGWEYEFGKYQFFYVIGSRRLMAQAGIFDQSRAADEADQVNGTIPDKWSSYFPAFDWTADLAKNQVRRAIRHEPQQFPKACQSLVAVLRAVTNYGRNAAFLEQHKASPVSQFLIIKPATFDIPEFDQGDCQKISNDAKQLILSRSRQKRHVFLSEAAASRRATYPTLRDIATCLGETDSFDKTATVAPMHKRSYGSKVSVSEIVDETL